MKKLLIAMTAAAVGTCAWADGDAGGEGTEPTTPATPVTYLNAATETFANWANGTDGYVTSVAAPWSYGTVAVDGEGNPTLNTADPQANELKVVNGALSLNTGSKVLRGAFGESAVAIPNDGLYFNAMVTFKDPSDTLPTLGAQDKFALVVLDNVESFEAEPKLATTQTTNLFVIAQYGEENGTKRAYKLTIPTELDADGNIANSITDLTADWLSAPKRIEVKAYSNVMADTEDARAGFLVSVDGFVCKVYASYPIVGGLIDFTDNGGVKFGMNSDEQYLGVAPTAITGSLQARYTDDQLILSLTDNASDLSSVDFQGQGDIDDVSLKSSATTEFGPDSLVLNVAKTDGITFEPGTSALMYYANGGSVTIKFTVAEGFELSSPAATDENLSYEGGVYTYVYTPTANNKTVTISAFEPVAVVDGVKYETVLAALAAIAENGGEVKLVKDVTIADAVTSTYGITISSGDVIIDLNGKTIVAGANEAENAYSSTFTVYGGSLLIKDSSEAKTGKVLISEAAKVADCYAINAQGGLTTIEAGQIGLIGNYSAETLELVGGTYTDIEDETFTYWGANEKDYGDKTYVATLDPDTGIWAVAEKQAPTTYAVTVEASENATVTDLTGGDVEAGTVLKFKAVANDGYKNLVVKAGEQVLAVDADGYYNYTVNAAVTITITVEAKAQFAVAVDATGATTTLNAGNYYEGTELSFTVAAAEGYDAPFTVKAGEMDLVPTEGTYTFTVNAAVTITVVATKKVVVPLQPLPENATDADVSAALGTQADTAVNANITTVDDYKEFQAWAAKAGTDKVAGSENAYAAYVLDAAGLLDETEKLADADIKVKAFAQDTAAGTFALEIKIKDCEIGPNANLEKLAELIIAEGTSELGNAEKPFASGNVTKTVTVDGDKAKFKVNAKDGNVKQFFFKMKFK